MHTIIEDDCTGCELCLPACPVDCIQTEVATPGRQAWQAWSPTQALVARQRYTAHQQRLGQTTPGLMAARHDAGSRTPPLRVHAQTAAAPLTAGEQVATSALGAAPVWPYRPQQTTPLAATQPVSSDDNQKRAAIAAALAKARASRRA